MAVFREREFWRHHAGVLIVAFLIVTMSRSIGTFHDLPALRPIALQSLIMVGVAFPLQTGGAFLALRYCPTSASMRRASLCGCVAAAVPSTATAMILIWIAGLAPGAGSTRADLLNWLRISYPAALGLHATLGSMLWTVLSYPWWQRHVGAATPVREDVSFPPVGGSVRGQGNTAPHVPPARPDFLNRLSPKSLGTLWALSSERHYVRVRTDAGEELVLMRLADAIEQCRHLDGLRIHRSH